MMKLLDNRIKEFSLRGNLKGLEWVYWVSKMKGLHA